MKEKYGVIEEEQPKFPVRSLLRVPHQGGVLIVSAFGPNYHDLVKMYVPYCYPHTREVISFREPTTAESISAIAYNFTGLVNPEILDSQTWLVGRVFNASEWVVINPPRNKKGEIITDDKALKKYLDNAVRVNGIYKLPNGKLEGIRDCSFVPYESFRQKVQSSKEFVRMGLARGLEYVDGKKAKNLEVISTKKDSRIPVDVLNFKHKNEVAVVSLDLSFWPSQGDLRLHVRCHQERSPEGYYLYNCAFRVLKKQGK